MGTEKTRDVLQEVLAERERQESKWGEQNHPDGVDLPGDAAREVLAREACEVAAREGRVTYRHILDEEAAEVNAAPTRELLRKELIQLAAVASAWVEKLDREDAAEAAHPKHSEDEPFEVHDFGTPNARGWQACGGCSLEARVVKEIVL